VKEGSRGSKKKTRNQKQQVCKLTYDIAERIKTIKILGSLKLMDQS
jgi:hypothetical protein